MKNVVLRPNAIPVYGFLSNILARESPSDVSQTRTILDCGAGGPVPPLALFHQHGFECWGIDVSKEQLEKARRFSDAQGITLYLREGDMRHIPFEDGAFDYVYEHYAMCHLSKQDTALAVREMHRVLKPGGLCFLGVISADTWPKSLFGQEKAPGKYWGEEGGHAHTLHSLFTDREAYALLAAWELVSKQKQLRYLWEAAAETSLAAWMALYEEAADRFSQSVWQAKYGERANAFRYVHVYYLLKKL